MVVLTEVMELKGAVMMVVLIEGMEVTVLS